MNQRTLEIALVPAAARERPALPLGADAAGKPLPPPAVLVLEAASETGATVRGVTADGAAAGESFYVTADEARSCLDRLYGEPLPWRAVPPDAPDPVAWALSGA